MQQLTTFASYNVSKSDEGRFVVTLNSNRTPHLSFPRYIDCLNKVMALNAGYSDKTLPKYKKLFKTNSRGATKAAPMKRTLSG